MRKEVIAQKDPKSPISELFRTIRTNIQFMNANKKMKTLLVTSTFPGEGKSWVASNLAVTFAQAGKRVVLIDADMRKGRQYVIFGTSPTPGLSNLLSELEIDKSETFETDIVNYIQETEVENLFLISSGNVPPNPSELLVSTQMIKMLEKLKNLCDIIIIDGTPCELVTDSVILSRIVDSTVVVTAYKITKREALQRVIKNIQNVGGNLAGVILNRIPISNKKYEEKYYYYGNEKVLDKNKSLGLDYSSHDFYVDSQNRSPEHLHHYYRDLQNKLAFNQRKLSHMTKGSNNYQKQKIVIARIHEKISNQRKDFIEKESTKLSNLYDIICLEDINMRNMSQSLKLGKSTLDNAFGKFRVRLEQKMFLQGKQVVKIDKWFPSSKMCRFCGHVNKDLKLSDRAWTCECGAILNRDENAAINILNEGLKRLA